MSETCTDQGKIVGPPAAGEFPSQAERKNWGTHVRQSDWQQSSSVMGRRTRTHSEPRSYWAASVGTGGYHFRIHSDDWIHRRNQQVDRMEQTQKGNAGARGRYNILHHSSDRDHLRVGEIVEPRKDQKLTKYDVNGFAYASSVYGSPAPEQNPKPAHWVCQVNGITGQYNIVNNLEPNPFIKAYRDFEVGKFRAQNAGKMTPAGSVQPKPVVTCHDMTSFVPVRKRTFANYSLIKPNL